MLLCGDGLVSNLLLLYMRHTARESSSFSGSRAFPPGDPLLACGQFTLRPIESSIRPCLCINAGRFFPNLLLLYMRHAARESSSFSGSRASPYRIFEKTPPLHKCRQVLFESSAFIYETCRPRKQNFLGLAGFPPRGPSLGLRPIHLAPYRIFEKTPPLHKCRQVLFESSACLIANAQKNTTQLQNCSCVAKSGIIPEKSTPLRVLGMLSD